MTVYSPTRQTHLKGSRASRVLSLRMRRLVTWRGYGTTGSQREDDTLLVHSDGTLGSWCDSVSSYPLRCHIQYSARSTPELCAVEISWICAESRVLEDLRIGESDLYHFDVLTSNKISQVVETLSTLLVRGLPWILIIVQMTSLYWKHRDELDGVHCMYSSVTEYGWQYCLVVGVVYGLGEGVSEGGQCDARGYGGVAQCGYCGDVQSVRDVTQDRKSDIVRGDHCGQEDKTDNYLGWEISVFILGVTDLFERGGGYHTWEDVAEERRETFRTHRVRQSGSHRDIMSSALERRAYDSHSDEGPQASVVTNIVERWSREGTELLLDISVYHIRPGTLSCGAVLRTSFFGDMVS
ncbi:hypothetical protein Tco_0974278 [Tanacetum coccineum]|uniref:Uncharacterized protein n=1 Tax=Tanacetum coccineum TaxID=301880 RepID=A0ABQ5EB54_9ASTR